jgi:hypothetical protein
MREFKGYQQFLIVLLVSLAPAITLLIRGIVWGADSFAFWSYSCGNIGLANSLNSNLFTSFIYPLINCNFHNLIFLMWVFYFLGLLSIWIFAKALFHHQAWRLAVYVGALTPLFFLEGIRFENDLFGWCLMFIALGLWAICIEVYRNKPHLSVITLLLCISCAIFSVLFWTGSLILVPIFALIYLKNLRWIKWVVIYSILIFLLFQTNSIINSFASLLFPEKWIAEEIPFVGLIFILHILHTYKYIPIKFKLYGIFLLCFGAVKAKFMFLAIPLLLIGLLDKQIKSGLVLKKEIMGIKEIPVLYICGILLIGWVIMGVSAYPTQNDLMDMKQGIQLAKDQNITLYNSWGDGWMFVSLGFDTNYKSSIPNPDWNNLQRPYLAWSQNDLYNCTKIKNRIWKCD